MNNFFYDLSNPQKSILLTERYFEGSNLNNICGTAIVNEKLNFELLEKAINNVIRANDSFRIMLKKNNNNKLVQYVSEYNFVPIELVNLKSENDVDALEQSTLSHVFNIEEKLFEFKMFKFPNNSGGFLLNIHHIIADGWTLGLTCRKIMIAYSILNNELEPEDFSSSYIEYLNSEQDYLNSEKYLEDKAYWQNIYSTIPDSITIPGSLNSKELSSKANRKEFILDKDFLNKIKEYCANTKISVFNFFMAVLSIYMYKISNTNDFVIGTPILNRTNFKEKNTNGMFINVSPFRINIDNSIEFLEFAKKISHDSRDMLKHQKYSYNQLLEELRKTDSTIPNLYNIVLSYQVTKANNVSNYHYKTRWAFNGNTGEDIELQLYDLDDTGSFNFAYDYKINKYTEEDIENINSRLMFISNQILENNSIVLKDIEITLPLEKEQILKTNTFVDFDFSKNIIDLFEENVNKNPNHIAVIDDSSSITYAELNNLANKFAHFLLSKNVKQHSTVAISMRRNHFFIAGILGILKLGCNYLPIFPEYPEERISYILNDSNAVYFLNDFDLKIDFANKTNINALNLDDYEGENIHANISLDDLAYIIYTSGSTGKPKGVMLKHSNLLNFLHSFNYKFDNKFGFNDNCLALTNIAFDVSVCEIFTPLAFNSCLVLYPENVLTNIPLLCEILEKHKITFLYLPPNLIDTTYNFIEENSIKTFINKMLVGVEPIKNKTLNNFYKLNENIEIINGYGPTETTICCTFFKHEKTNSSLENEIVPIGAPLSNNTLLILNKDFNVMPLKTIGQIYVSGKNVAKGYLNNPELTKKSFININGKIFYNTGDNAYLEKNGNIHFIGRNDSQIKFKGNRIELNEINLNIKKIPNVSNSITLIKNINGIDYLCSYVIADNSMKALDIQNYLKKSLPHYMIPTYIMFLEEFPITSNGKIDKKSLPDFKITSKKIKTNLTKTEKLICDFLSKTLNIQDIDVTENIFNIGVDSLIAISLISEIYSKLNKKIFIQDIFQNFTITDLAKFIDDTQTIEKEFKLKQAKPQDFYPTTSAQKNIFYASSISNNTAYNITGGIEIFEEIDISKIEDCFNELIKRHESFRTKFEFKNGDIIQSILPEAKIKIEILTKENISKNKLFDKFNKEFDLSVAPLLRVGVAKISENDYLILISTHHIIVDGSSFRIFIDEFCKLYGGEALPAIKNTYKDYANFEKEILEQDVFKDAKEYWFNKFNREIPTLNMPTTYSRPNKFTYNGSKISKTLNQTLTNEVLEFCQKQSITPFIFMITCFYVLLYKYTNNTEILIGTPVANRDFVPGITDIIGMFVNTLVIDGTIDSEETFIDFCQKIKNISLESFKYQNYPFNELVKALNIKRDLSRNLLFDTMFTYQNNGMPKIDAFSNWSYFLPDSKISKYDLSLEVVPNNSSMELNFEYCTDLYSKQFIDDFAKHYIEIIKNAIHESNAKIKDIQMLDKKEFDNLIFGFNKTQLDYPKTTPVYKLFEKQVNEHPNKIAVIFENARLTYEELNKKANNLAYFMQENGIKEGEVIGILLNRSLEVLICQLAVLKLGCAYVPIDPTYPEHRVKYILDNSKMAIILTEPSVKEKFSIDCQMINCKLDNTEIYTDVHSENLNIKFSIANLAYIIYTSGSTGNPKGVMLTNKGLVNLIYSINNQFNFNRNWNIVSLTTICFDIFIFESIYPLCSGMTTIMTTNEQQNIPKLLNKLSKEHCIDILQTTPSRFMLLLSDDSSLDFIKNAKAIVMGGEAVPSNLIKKLKSITNARLINGYGPTETTVYASFKDLTNTNEINIGTPVANSSMYILDDNYTPLPVGVPGNLFISGDGVGKGYLNRDDLTIERFIEDPFVPNAKMYDTGDIAKFMPNGDIVYIGRSDFQVKVHGLRIELGEIEKQISSFENILNTAVTVKQDSNERDILCAYFKANKKININKLKEFLRKKIPEYMIPVYFKQMDEFKYTPNGKIDRKSLPNPEFINTKEIIAPETPTEKLVTKIVEHILTVHPISITDNLFDIGADSLTALRLQIELLSENINIPYSDIFKYNTIKDLSLRIDSSTQTEVTLQNDSYDYTEINNLISKNNFETLNNIKFTPIENVILTGSTGFLGAHILSELIDNHNVKVFCLVRKDSNETKIFEKLKRRLNFYFGDKYDNEFGNKIIPIESDLCSDDLNLSKNDYDLLKNNASIIINSAANVKHYGYYSDFEKINVKGVKNLIKFALDTNKKFIQISTASVSGNTLVGANSKLNNFGNIINYNEQSFFVNQSFENVYTYSKFEAEKLVFENIIKNNLDGLVLRVGYITSRYSDGVFQINNTENAFYNRIRTFVKLNCIPESLKNFPVEFTPVDSLAKAIINSIEFYNNSINVLHLYNPNHIIIEELVSAISENASIIPDDDFRNFIRKILKDPNKRNIISYIVNDMDQDFNLIYSSDIRLNNDFTVEFLKRTGFNWPIIDKKYIKLLLYLFE